MQFQKSQITEEKTFIAVKLRPTYTDVSVKTEIGSSIFPFAYFSAIILESKAPHIKISVFRSLGWREGKTIGHYISRLQLPESFSLGRIVKNGEDSGCCCKTNVIVKIPGVVRDCRFAFAGVTLRLTAVW